MLAKSAPPGGARRQQSSYNSWRWGVLVGPSVKVAPGDALGDVKEENKVNMESAMEHG